MNNNRTDEAAVLGVFSKTSYITFGEQEKPLSYVQKVRAQIPLPADTQEPPWTPSPRSPVAQSDNRSNFKGKQMMTTLLKEGKTNDVYFEKKHNWIFDGDKFRDRMMYQASRTARHSYMHVHMPASRPVVPLASCPERAVQDPQPALASVGDAKGEEEGVPVGRL